MTTPHLPQAQLDLFTVLFMLGNSIGSERDTRAILELLNRVRPDLPLIAASLARQINLCGDYQSSRLLLEEADRQGTAHPVVKAMLALTLFSQGDRLWEAYAGEVKAMEPDEIALGIVNAMEKVLRGESHADGDAEPSTESTPANAVLFDVATDQPWHFGSAC